MTDQNSGIEATISGVERQIRPDEVMQEFNIKKDAYYDRLRRLGIKAAKGNQGKVYLTEAQFELMKQLDFYIQKHGTMDGFTVSQSGEIVDELWTESTEDEPSQLAIADESGNLLNQVVAEPMGEELGFEQFEALVRAAAEMAGQRLVMPDLVKLEIANRMTYEDLPADIKAKVDSVRESASPKHQPSHLAEQLLNQWRDRNQAAAATA
jgi:hypothetical protein